LGFHSRVFGEFFVGFLFFADLVRRSNGWLNAVAHMIRLRDERRWEGETKGYLAAATASTSSPQAPTVASPLVHIHSTLQVGVWIARCISTIAIKKHNKNKIQ
jgi:hypothetical protein